MKRFNELVVIVVFLMIIFAIPILSCFGKDKVWDFYEFRSMTQIEQVRNELSTQSLQSGALFQTLESYLSDQIFQRDAILASKTWLDLNIFQRPVVNDIYTGQKALVSANPDTGGNRNDLLATIQYFGYLNDLVTSYGGTLLIVNVPHQSSAFREEYPEYLEIDYTSMDQDNQWMAKTLETMGVPYLDMSSSLLPDYEKYYSHNDHHYNLFGAYETYLAVMERLTPVLGDLPIFTEDQFTWKELSEYDYYGSRNRKLYMLSPFPEHGVYYEEKNHLPFPRYDDNKETQATVFHIDEDAENPRINYSLYMNGDNPKTRIETDREELPDLLIFGNSFTNAFETFAYHSFNTMTSLDFRYYEGETLTHYIMENRPDAVVCIKDNTSFYNLSGMGARYGQR